MYNYSLSVIESSDLTIEKINEKIEKALDRTVFKRKTHLHRLRTYIREVCKKPTGSYVGLMQYYAGSKHEESYDKITAGFLTRYEGFIKTFGSLLESNKGKKFFCCLFALTWLEILDELEETAKEQKDMLARSISMQLQADIIRMSEFIFQ